MDQDEKIRLIEEIMELESGVLSEESILEEYDEWDSLTVISYMALIDARFHKSISIERIKHFVTVGDAIREMQ